MSFAHSTLSIDGLGQGKYAVSAFAIGKSSRVCSVCEGPIHRDRHKGTWCSKKCEAEAQGYSAVYVQELDREARKAAVNGSTAWRPEPLAIIKQINSASPVTIGSDIHCPLQSAPWINHMLDCAISKKSETLILNGDFLDANQISKHAGSYYRRNTTLESDFAAAEVLISLFCKTFKNVYLLMGNHDMRLVHKFGGELSVERIFKMAGSHPNFHITPRSFVYVNEKVAVVHPRQYASARGSLAQKLSLLKHKSVLTGHQHHSAMSISPDGLHQACDVGTMVDIELQDYVKNEFNTFVEPINGFAMIFGNYIQVFDRFTKWDLFGLPEPEKPLP